MNQNVKSIINYMKFSIITCTLNSDKFIRENIESVKAQTYDNFEHVFVDGFSTDDTMNIIEEYRREYPKNVKVFQQKPSGIASAMNFGVEQSTADLISFLHSDDLFFDNSVLKKMNGLFSENKKAEWCFGGIVDIDSAGKIIKKYKLPRYSYQLLKRTNLIPHPSVFMTRSLFKRIHGFKKFKYAMDYDMWLRIGDMVKPLQVDWFVAKFRRHDKSLSTVEARQTIAETYKIRRRLSRSPFIRLKDLINYIHDIVTH